MNREEALLVFIKQHLRQLTDSNTTHQSVKTLRQKFFEHNSLPAASRFSNNEVATQVLREILKVKKIQSKEEARKVVDSIPFLTDECHDCQIDALLQAPMQGSNSLLSPEDLKKIGQEQYLVKVEQAFEERAKAKALSQLDREREELGEMKRMLLQEKKSLEVFKSALDALPPDLNADEMISQDLAARTADDSGIWWRNLGLESDPFGSNQGLFGIPPEKYDDVVVQTPFVKSYLTRIRDAPKDLLGKTIIMLGDFGSGKTTIFQLVAYTAGKSKFLPVLATINPDQNIEKLLKQFTTQLSSRICDAYPLRIQLDRQSYSFHYDDIGWCIQIMDLARKSGTEGFMVFIDGLHKSETYMKQSLEFLQHIQNFQERVASSGISCGILIAGSPAWEVELKSNPSLSGSYYSIERVPPLSEEAAVEAVVRRINSFLAPGTPRPSIEPRQLRNAFSILSTRLYRPPTFRDYLDHIRSRLVAGEYDNLGISISLHAETIEYVKREIVDSPLATGYSRLMDPRRHTSSFRKVVGIILPLIQMRGKAGIAESEPIFRENTGAFLVLLNEGFIAPHRSPDHLSLAWYPSPDLIAFLQTIQRKNNMLPQDVLNALFADEAKIVPKESESYYGGIKSLLKELSASWRSSWPEVCAVLDDCADRLSRIERLCDKPETLSSEGLLENLRSTLKAMTKSVMFVLGRKDAMVDDQIFERFYESWIAPENRDSYRSILNHKTVPKDLPHCFGLMHQHSQAMNDLIKMLTDLIKGEAIVRLVGRTLTTDETTRLHEARTLFLSTQYVETVSKVADILDKKTKDILYVALRCYKGDGYLSFIPADIKGRYAQNDIGGHPRTKRTKDQNIFYDMNRSEYSKILFQKNLRKLVLEDTIDDIEIAQLKNAWEIVFALADRDAHNDRPSYFRKHSTEISSVLQWTPKLCEMLNKTIDKLMIGGKFSYEKSGPNSIRLRFGEASDSEAIPVHEAEVEAIVFELLFYANESHEIHVPPLEGLLGVLSYQPEKVVGLLRASVGQELLSIDRIQDPFALTIRISQKGRERLEQLKLKRASRNPNGPGS